MILFIAATFPVLVFLFLIYRKDKMREPLSLLTKCFFAGFLSVLIALALNIPIQKFFGGFTDPFQKSFFDAFFVAAIPEEFGKFIILYWIIWKNKEFDQYFDGIIYSVFISLGFAFLENLMYVYSGGMGVAALRAITSIPAHGFFAVLMGYYFSLAKFYGDGKRNYYLFMSMLVPVIFHGLYDFFLMSATNHKNQDGIVGLMIILFIIFDIQLWRLAFKRIKKLVEKDKVL